MLLCEGAKMLSVRYRKYHYPINSSYSIYDGSNIDFLHEAMVNDTVHILFPMTRNQLRSIEELGKSHLRENISCSYGRNDECLAHIPFKVVERRHSLSWYEVGQLRKLGMSIVLEATDGYWEDIFLWIACGETPNWARDEEASHE